PRPDVTQGRGKKNESPRRGRAPLPRGFPLRIVSIPDRVVLCRGDAMFFRNYVLLPLRRFWQALKPYLLMLDQGLVTAAAPVGVRHTAPRRRYLHLLTLYLAIYVLALLPLKAVSLAALVFGYVGVLAVGRAWVANEKKRTEIVKKLDNTDPDSLPDLR